MRIKYILLLCVLIFASCSALPEKEPDITVPPSEAEPGYLRCIHTNLNDFYDSVKNPKEYKLTGNPAGGVVPHHMAAAALISGFFDSIAKTDIAYDTAVIIAPNHEGGSGDIVVSFLDWQVWDTVYCDLDIVGAVYNKRPDGCIITESDERVEADHSVSVLIPYISHYLPGVKVAPFLLSRRLTLETVYNFSKILSDEIKNSGKKTLFVASVDFSHYLPASKAVLNDRVTEAAIMDRNYRAIQEFSNDYVDSPQSLNTFLLCMANADTDNIEILYNTNMSEFYSEGINETTSYFIIAAYD
jgi:AmmeMemoRadiSam system protein B